MKKVSCKDIKPDTNCDYEASGNSPKEVLGKMMAHVKAEHNADIKDLSDADIQALIQQKMHS